MAGAPGAERIATDAYPFPFSAAKWISVRCCAQLAKDRATGRPREEIARAFQRGIAMGLCETAKTLARTQGLETVVLSGGVFQNELLLEDLNPTGEHRVQVWTNQSVPPNDGGISLGQAALAAFCGAGELR